MISGNQDLAINILTYDSRKVSQGALFICLAGSKVDGHNFIEQAKAQGAIAVLVEKDVSVKDITIIKVEDTRKAMQIIAPWFYDYPGRKLRMIGVTGTNGKTTTTHIIRSILREAGYKVGLIGTIHSLIEDTIIPAQNTTPDVLDLQQLLADMVNQGMDYVVMEVSSHALALNRVAGCEFDIGVFTNITRDHLDFHQTFDNYVAAKASLFEKLSGLDNVKNNKVAVVNIDDTYGHTILEHSECEKITYGVSNSADIWADNIQIRADGSSLSLCGITNLELELKITGMFNVYNVMAGIGAALAEGIVPEIIAAALKKFTSVPGRFELVNEGQSFSVIVDYAHTPDGLENVLKTAKAFAQKRIIVVFGCGGDRDRTKRPIMGRIAANYADVVIATSDNPRTEDPEFILSEVEQGIRETGKSYEKIMDRRQAIKHAVASAKAGDIILIAGKGHETYQILHDRTIHFDDREVARECIKELRLNG